MRASCNRRTWLAVLAPALLAPALLACTTSPPAAHPAARTRRTTPAPATDGAFVLAHAHVYGVAPSSDAVLVRDGVIARIGSSNELMSSCAAPCSVVDAKGGFLTPGFDDGHVHLAMAGDLASQLLVLGASVPKIQAAVKGYAEAIPKAPWILGHGFSGMGMIPHPTRASLDTAEASRPVVLTDHTGHNAWVNTAALRVAGITKDTPDPPGGKIVRDERGEPTGYLLDAASSLVLRKRPVMSEADREAALLHAESLSLRAACTSSQGGPVPLVTARTYARLDREGKLRQRVFLWGPLLAEGADLDAWLDFARALPETGKVHLIAFKGFADGTLEARTAALLEPYADDPSNRGQLYISQEALDQTVVRVNRAGFPAAIHAIGDRAVRSALDAFAYSRDVLHHGLMNRVEHASLVAPEDAGRFAELGVAASVQPVWIHGYPSRAWMHTLETELGTPRFERIYPWRDLADAHAFLIFGSDFPASDLYDPLTGIYAAGRRETRDGFPFFPNERIDEDLAVRAYTENPAIAAGAKNLGKIAVGYQADLVLLDHDPRGVAKGLADDPMRRMWIAGREVTP